MIGDGIPSIRRDSSGTSRDCSAPCLHRPLSPVGRRREDGLHTAARVEVSCVSAKSRVDDDLHAVSSGPTDDATEELGADE